MKRRPSYVCPSNHVCRFQKSLNGLKQASRAWFDKFKGAILKSGLYQRSNNNSFFIRHSPRGCTNLLLLYVDDIITNENDD